MFLFFMSTATTTHQILQYNNRDGDHHHVFCFLIFKIDANKKNQEKIKLAQRNEI